MKKPLLNGKTIIICLTMLFTFSAVFGQSSQTVTIDLHKAGIIIDSLDKQYAWHYFNGDSIAVYKMYTKDASFGSLKGNDILLAIGKMIRNSFKNDTRIIEYTTSSLSTDSEFLIEVGTYKIKDSKGSIKDNGKYLVVWKQENGNWRLYRDIGL